MTVAPGPNPLPPRAHASVLGRWRCPAQSRACPQMGVVLLVQAAFTRSDDPGVLRGSSLWMDLSPARPRGSFRLLSRLVPTPQLARPIRMARLHKGFEGLIGPIEKSTLVTVVSRPVARTF